MRLHVAWQRSENLRQSWSTGIRHFDVLHLNSKASTICQQVQVSTITAEPRLELFPSPLGWPRFRKFGSDHKYRADPVLVSAPNSESKYSTNPWSKFISEVSEKFELCLLVHMTRRGRCGRRFHQGDCRAAIILVDG